MVVKECFETKTVEFESSDLLDTVFFRKKCVEDVLCMYFDMEYLL